MCSESFPTRPDIPPRILRPVSYKSRVRQLWQGRGPTYDSQDTFHQALAEALVERANILPANKVLDVATGTGMAALQAAKRVGLEGTVVGVDLSDSMLAKATSKATAAALCNIDFIQADIESAEFAAGSFDVIICSSGMIYLQELSTAMKRFLCWLKPSGRLCFNTPQEPCVPATHTFFKLLADYYDVHLADAAAELGTPKHICQIATAAGFSTIQVTETMEYILFKNCSPEDYAAKIWTSLTSAAVFTPLEGMASEQELSVMKPYFMRLVSETARGWITGEDIRNPYTMLWCAASK